MKMVIFISDAKGSPEPLEKGPLLHHFRCSSFKSEESYLKKCWLKCVERRSDLPIFRLQIEDTNGNMVVHHIDSASGDQISVEVVSDDLPNDELVSDSIMDSGVVARDGATEVAGSDERANLSNVVVGGINAVVACENLVVE